MQCFQTEKAVLFYELHAESFVLVQIGQSNIYPAFACPPPFHSVYGYSQHFSTFSNHHGLPSLCVGYTMISIQINTNPLEPNILLQSVE